MKENRSGDTAKTLFEFLLFGSIAIAANLVEDNFELAQVCGSKWGVKLRAIAKDNVVSFALGEKGKDCFAGGMAMSGKKLADDRADRDGLGAAVVVAARR